MARNLLLVELRILVELRSVPSAGRPHPKAAAHPSHEVWPVLPASRCSASCIPAISAAVFSIVGLQVDLLGANVGFRRSGIARPAMQARQTRSIQLARIAVR